MEVDTKNGWLDKFLFWGFCCMFFFLPIATSPAVIAGGLSLGIWIFSGKFIKERQRWFNQDWTTPVLLSMLLPWIGLLWSDNLSEGLNLAQKSHYWLYTFAIASICPPYSFIILIKAFLAGLSLNVSISILQYLGIVPMLKGCPAGFMGPITYSLLLVFGLLLLSFYYRRVKGRRYQIFLILLMVTYLFSLSVNTGRIGYLAVVILSPWILYNILGRKHLLKIAVGILIWIIILSLSPTVRDRTKQALDDVKAYYHGDKNTSVGMRLHMWEGAIKIFLQKPILGVGTGGYMKAMMKYKDDPNLPDFAQPHNSFLYIASSYGIVGLFLLLWLFVVFMRKGWHARESIEGFSVLSFGAVLLIGSLTDTQILSLSTAKMFALLTGLRTK